MVSYDHWQISMLQEIVGKGFENVDFKSCSVLSTTMETLIKKGLVGKDGDKYWVTEEGYEVAQYFS